MIVSIGGTMGAGKSTLAKDLARELRWPRYYMGQIFRDLAREKGIALQEYIKHGEKDSRIDRQVDAYQIKLGRTKDNFVIEGRTSFFLIPHSLKIYLYCDPDTAARRIFRDLKINAKKRNEGSPATVLEVKKNLERRMATDRKRYRQYYQKNVFNPRHYDLAIDSSRLTKKQVLKKVLKFCRAKLGEKITPQKK